MVVSICFGSPDNPGNPSQSSDESPVLSLKKSLTTQHLWSWLPRQTADRITHSRDMRTWLIKLFCKKMMRCPTCDKELRALQVETMIGNPSFNEWSRNGYCSHDCYERRDPSHAPVELKPQVQKAPDSVEAARTPPSIPARDPIYYSLAKFCLLAVPLYLGIAAVGNLSGLHRFPSVAFYYFIILGAFIMFAGLASGIAALIAIRKHGADGLFWKSVIGISLILGFTYLGVSGILKTKAESGPGE